MCLYVLPYSFVMGGISSSLRIFSCPFSPIVLGSHSLMQCLFYTMYQIPLHILYSISFNLFENYRSHLVSNIEGTALLYFHYNGKRGINISTFPSNSTIYDNYWHQPTHHWSNLVTNNYNHYSFQ